MIKLAMFAALVVSVALQIVGQESHGQESQEDRYNNAVALFASSTPGSTERACDMMKQLAQEAPSNPTYQKAKSTFCNQARVLLDTEKQTAQIGILLAQGDKCSEARAYYQHLLQLATRNPTYRTWLDTAIRNCEARSQQQTKNSPAQQGGQRSDDALRAGLVAYFTGELKTAENDFTTYLDKPEDHKALAFFFRGTTRLSVYYLSGETDIASKNSAVADFHEVKTGYRTFHPPVQYISPKILAFYNAQR